MLYCVSPPASFYQQVQLTGDSHLTTTLDWSSAQTSPEFKDGFLVSLSLTIVILWRGLIRLPSLKLQTFRDVPVNRNLLVLFDVRVVTRNAKTGTFTSQPFGWSFLPVLSDFGSIASTSMQLPLFQGEVNLVP